MNTSYILPDDKKHEILLMVLDKTRDITFQELDVSKSYRRINIDRSYETKMDILNTLVTDKSSMWTFIKRDTVKVYFEFIISGYIDTVEYFIWITLDNDAGTVIISQYNLEQK